MPESLPLAPLRIWIFDGTASVVLPVPLARVAQYLDFSGASSVLNDRIQTTLHCASRRRTVVIHCLGTGQKSYASEKRHVLSLPRRREWLEPTPTPDHAII